MPPASVTQFIINQWTWLPIVKKDLTGKTVIVVGANVGLGLEAARHFASMDPGKLILACRSVEKGQAALEDIRKTTTCNTMDVWQLDLESFASISAFADKFEREGGGRLDLLVENAGVLKLTFEQTNDGWEKTLQTNHLGTALLAFLLLPTLSKTPASDTFPRVVIVTSSLHSRVSSFREYGDKPILNALNDKNSTMALRYMITKLFNVWFTRSLASQLPSASNVTVSVVDPGLCHSSLARGVLTNLRLSIIIWVRKFFLARSTEVGSRTLVHASLSGTQDEMQGRYLTTCRVEEPSDYAISEEGCKVQKRIWEETIEILGRADPRVKDIVDRYLV